MVPTHSVPFQIQVSVSPRVVPSGQSKSISSPGSPGSPWSPFNESINAYRKIKVAPTKDEGKSTIHFANEVFEEIKKKHYSKIKLYDELDTIHNYHLDALNFYLRNQLFFHYHFQRLFFYMYKVSLAD